MITVELMMMVALAARSVNASVRPLDGVWQSNGWGFLHQIRGIALQAFEVTSTTCGQGFRAERLSSDAQERETTFRTGDDDVFHIVADRDDGHKRVVHPMGLTSVVRERLPMLPKIGEPPTANTPLGNFDATSRMLR